MLDKVKVALRIKTNDFDDEINDIIEAAYGDLGIAGVEGEASDPLIIRAVTTYCKANFGNPMDYDRLKASYDEQKAQLGMSTGYTVWTE